MLRYLISRHLQRPFFQVRSPSQVLGFAGGRTFSAPPFISLGRPVVGQLWLGHLQWWEAHYITSWLSSRPDRSNYFKGSYLGGVGILL